MNMEPNDQPETFLPGPSLQSPMKKPKDNFGWIALIISGLLVGGFCLFSIILGGLLAIGSAGTGSQEEWLVINDTFMKAIAGKDFDGAYGVYSGEAKKDFQRSDLASLANGTFYALFDGYESLELESWEINYIFPAGRFAELFYRIQYSNGYEGNLYAVLQEEGGHWKLYWIEVNIPPEKIDDYVGIETSN